MPGRKLTERSGTEKDCKRLKKCFKQLRFELRIYNDKKRKEIDQILFEGKTCFSQFLFLFCSCAVVYKCIFYTYSGVNTGLLETWELSFCLSQCPFDSNIQTSLSTFMRA